MAHFAKLDGNNIVLEVNVLNNEVIDNLPFPESEPIGIEFLTEWSGGYTDWLQTSYNGNFRKNYAGIGFTYDPIRDAFISPQPYPSWVINETTYQWEAPVPYSTDGKDYYWDEATLSWVEIPTE
jgi:hypothetical protein